MHLTTSGELLEEYIITSQSITSVSRNANRERGLVSEEEMENTQ